MPSQRARGHFEAKSAYGFSDACREQETWDLDSSVQCRAFCGRRVHSSSKHALFSEKTTPSVAGIPQHQRFDVANSRIRGQGRTESETDHPNARDPRLPHVFGGGTYV
ncbi:MAG: hypothetical protein ABR925_08950 [Acidimicrobiales bacterium]